VIMSFFSSQGWQCWDVEHGGFLYDSDSYADDLPYWTRVDGTDHLVVPYTLDTNDMKFVTGGGFLSGTEFFTHLRDAFDVLYAEGAAGSPKMLSIGLHCRLVGRPAPHRRAGALPGPRTVLRQGMDRVPGGHRPALDRAFPARLAVGIDCPAGR
jgi:peptidoglycan/xylan/chitin deacetylase (PgdA/CDA1 family)